MNINEIKKIASQYHINMGKAKKGELVRAIQEAEGNLPCFETNRDADCGQHNCLWREDCK